MFSVTEGFLNCILSVSNMILYYVSGPMLALCLAREDAISEWRKVLGPKIVEEAIQNDPES